VISTTQCNFYQRLFANDILVSKASKPLDQSGHCLSTSKQNNNDSRFESLRKTENPKPNSLVHESAKFDN
jgi:hypothetical protein